VTVNVVAAAVPLSETFLHFLPADEVDVDPVVVWFVPLPLPLSSAYAKEAASSPTQKRASSTPIRFICERPPEGVVV
jgi:hypothetical protein